MLHSLWIFFVKFLSTIYFAKKMCLYIFLYIFSLYKYVLLYVFKLCVFILSMYIHTVCWFKKWYTWQMRRKIADAFRNEPNISSIVIYALINNSRNWRLISATFSYLTDCFPRDVDQYLGFLTPSKKSAVKPQRAHYICRNLLRLLVAFQRKLSKKFRKFLQLLDPLHHFKKYELILLFCQNSRK